MLERLWQERCDVTGEVILKKLYIFNANYRIFSSKKRRKKNLALNIMWVVNYG